MRLNKNSLMSVLILVLVALISTGVSALNGTMVTKLDNDILNPDGENIYSYERGEKMDVKVIFTVADVADGEQPITTDNVEIEVAITGVHNERVSDTTNTFEVVSGHTYTKSLTLDFPERMDQAYYTLRVRISERIGNVVEETYDLKIDTQRNNVIIRDVILSPAETVKAGGALLATVRIRNYGYDTENDNKVTVSIPELGLSASDYIEELEGSKESDIESTSTEELYLRIPACAEAKTYVMDIEVEYDDGDEIASTTRSITVTEGDYCPTGYTAEAEEETAMTVITVGATSQDITRGEGGGTYPVTITNQGTATATYTVGVDSVGNWATFQLSPSNVVTVPARGTATIYVYVSARDNAAVGENMFSVTVNKGTNVLKQLPMKANVISRGATAATTAPSWGGLKKALEYALVVLVALLVIFGLIVGFNKLRSSDKGDEEEGGKTYY